MEVNRCRSVLGSTSPLPLLRGKVEHLYPSNSHCQVPTPPLGILALLASKGGSFAPSLSTCCVPVPGVFFHDGTSWGQPGPLSHLPKLPGGGGGHAGTCFLTSRHLSLAVSSLPGWTPCPLPGSSEPRCRSTCAPGRGGITDTHAGRAVGTLLPGDRLPGFGLLEAAALWRKEDAAHPFLEQRWLVLGS